MPTIVRVAGSSTSAERRPAFSTSHPRRDQEVTCPHWELAPFEQELPLALDDLVQLIHIVVGMKGVRLARFKRVEADQQARRLVQRALAKLVGAPDGVLGGVNHCGMFHESLAGGSGSLFSTLFLRRSHLCLTSSTK